MKVLPEGSQEARPEVPAAAASPKRFKHTPVGMTRMLASPPLGTPPPAGQLGWLMYLRCTTAPVAGGKNWPACVTQDVASFWTPSQPQLTVASELVLAGAPVQGTFINTFRLPEVVLVHARLT